MTLSSRERIIRTIEIGGALPDKLPFYMFGLEPTASAHKKVVETEEYRSTYEKYISKMDWAHEKIRRGLSHQIAIAKYFKLDLMNTDPFRKLKKPVYDKAPPSHPGLFLQTMEGRLFDVTPNGYYWYTDGYFKTPEKVDEIWSKYGKPHERLQNIDYDPQLWRRFIEELEGIFYPVPHIPITFFSALFEGVTPSRVAYYMRKNPEFLHYLLKEYTRTQCDMVNLLHDAGVEVVEWGDDVGVKGRLAISLNQFKEFILPYYKQLYQHVRKKGMMMIQHSCGYVDPALPYMAEAGLHAIQALQQTAGVDLKHLVESLGDKIAFMGALDDSRIMAFGTPKEVKEDVKKCIKIAGKTGNYAPGPSHGILNASLENLNALRDSIDKYSKFPISF